MDLKSEAYQQNYQQFRSLNQIMWQIPVLAMTLTGGLWFGVSRIPENTWLVTALLFTAVVGNGALFAVLFRFRHVMDCYLAWVATSRAGRIRRRERKLNLRQSARKILQSRQNCSQFVLIYALLVRVV